MTNRRRDLLYDSLLVVTSAGTAIAVYWGLIQLQRKYWRYKGKAKARIPHSLLHCDWAKEILIATQAALAAGHNIRKHAENSQKNVEYKGSIDLVTQTDKDNEEAIVGLITGAFPDHIFIGEESVGSGAVPELTDQPTWIIDPIDGTTNFVHGLPFSCVSIGFAVGKQVVMGVVYDPYKDELFLAAKGKGSYVNGKKLKASATTDLDKAIIIQEWGYERSEVGIGKLLSVSESLLKHNVQSLRQLGSGALDLCYVAAGRVDGVYTGVAGEGWKPWDYCAGMVIVTESGGVISTLRGEDFSIYSKSMVCAANEVLARKLIGSVASSLR